MTDKTPERPICQYCGKTPRTTLKQHWKHCDKKPPGKRGRPKGTTGTAKTGGKTGGRQKGAINKTSATAKQNFQAAFEKMGGVDAMVNWGIQNQTEFYKLYAKLLPIDMNNKHNVDAMPALTVNLTSKPKQEDKKDDGDEES